MRCHVFAILASVHIVAACSRPQHVQRTRVVPSPPGVPGLFTENIDATVFQRGNIHTHSRNSDGDSQPEAVYEWYRDHGYNFLGLSDHNFFTDPREYRDL